MTVQKQRKPGWWYPYIFVAGFGVIIAVNGTMAYFASSTFTGLKTERSYDDGLKFNKTLAAAEAQRALGWSVVTDVAPKADLPNGGKLANVYLEYKDKAGQPLNDLTVKVTFLRPVQAGLEQTVTLAPVGEGKYRGEIELPLKGQWQIAVQADGPAHHELHQRVYLP